MASDGEIGVFTPEQARLLWQDYQTRRQLQPHVSKNFPQRRPVADVSPHRVFIKNTTAEVIPAYACVRVLGTEIVGGRTTITVEKPTDTEGQFLFNSQFEIKVESDTEAGVGWAYRYGVVVMLGDPPTTAGESYQPIVGSWEVEAGAGPFVVFGDHNVDPRGLIGRINASGGGGGDTRHWAVLVDDLPADPGIYPTGTITSGNTALTTSQSLSAYINDYTVIVCGAGASGGHLITTISSVAGLTATLGASAQTSVTDADVVILAVADVWILKRNSCGRLIQLIEDGSPVTKAVVNRFRAISIEADTLIGIEYQEGEWTPYKMDCEPSLWEWPAVAS